MFAPISSVGMKLNEDKYLISLGFVLPDDVKPEDVKDKPEFIYVIQKEVGEGEDKKLELVLPPEDGETNPIFAQLDNTAKVYAKGFTDGVSYYNAVYGKKPANDNKSNIITE
ncbi:hypothetical protein J6W34_00130 [bacterium]|nr:hypothetical protein [bacterium]